jgi:hypothetical protein
MGGFNPQYPPVIVYQSESDYAIDGVSIDAGQGFIESIKACDEWFKFCELSGFAIMNKKDYYFEVLLIFNTHHMDAHKSKDVDSIMRSWSIFIAQKDSYVFDFSESCLD